MVKIIGYTKTNLSWLNKTHQSYLISPRKTINNHLKWKLVFQTLTAVVYSLTALAGRLHSQKQPAGLREPIQYNSIHFKQGICILIIGPNLVYLWKTILCEHTVAGGLLRFNFTHKPAWKTGGAGNRKCSTNSIWLRVWSSSSLAIRLTRWLSHGEMEL